MLGKILEINCPKLYWILAFLRFALVFLPQTGYIHPDEYFQSTEVLAGRIFDVEINQPWEFNVSFPLRSVVVPYFTIGASYGGLKIINYFVKEYFESALITAYTVLVIPRLLICCLSFLVDFSLCKICTNNNEKYRSRLIILASSYVLIVFGTRTFSNTFELILFSLLLYYVADSLTFTNTVVKKREYLNARYREAKTPVDKAKWYKLITYLKPDIFKNCVQVSTIAVIGFFNRPTFVAFAVAPVFFWLYRGLGCRSVVTLNFHMRMVCFLVCCIPTLLFAIIVDSFYYGFISWGEIGMFDVSINSFVFTPLNFVKYNINPNNLAQHGIHSKYLHVLVNIPLLFNVLGVFGIVGFVNIVHRIFQCKYHLLPTVRSIKGLMTLSVIIPVGVLSIFPHQEPRFLIPILLPLTYLYANDIYDEPETFLVEVAEENHRRKSDKKIINSGRSLLKMWLCINALFVVFYGFVHQGGVFSVAAHLSDEFKSHLTNNYYIVTSHVYSIPESFFLQAKSNEFLVPNFTIETNKRVTLFEEGSRDLSQVVKKLKSLSEEKDLKTYLVIPSSLRTHLQFIINKHRYFNVFPKLVRTFYPHISTEAFPDFTQFCLDNFPFITCIEGTLLPFFDYVNALITLCGLDLYEIS